MKKMFIDDIYSLENKQETENGFEAKIQLDPEHFVYKAHFPGNPITPGVCILEIAKQLLSSHLEANLRLVTVKNLKFLQVLIPKLEEQTSFKFVLTPKENNQMAAKIVIADTKMALTKISAIYKVG